MGNINNSFYPDLNMSGFSGSNGGISEAYRKFVVADVEAGISKYEDLKKTAPKEIQPIYQNLINNLSKVRESILEEKVK